MDRSKHKSPKYGLIVTTALASVALWGCSTSAAPRADTSFSKAQSALNKGKVSDAIAHAESAVLAEPRNPGFRAMLGTAYLKAGRFEAAATAFNDALDLGDANPRTVLSYALAAIAIGDSDSALKALAEREGDLNPADYGLALSLAGKPERAIHVLTNALRGGQNTSKVRQNLAYTYALAGNWRGARVMAAEDVPADQLDARLTEWASNARPEDVRKRVAKLLGVSASNAGAHPAHLALSNFPSQAAMVAEAAAQVDAPVVRELGEADLASNDAAPSVSVDPVEVVTPSAPAKLTQSERMAFGEDSDRIESVDPAIATILAATAPAGAASAPPVEVPVVAPVAPTKVATAPTTSRFFSSPVVQQVNKSGSKPNKEVAPTPVEVASVARAVAPVAAPVATQVKQPAAPTTLAVAPTSSRFFSSPVVQMISADDRQQDKAAAAHAARQATQLRRARPSNKAPTRTASASDKSRNSHMVQLGSYSSRAEAKRGWASLQSKFPELKGHDVVITKAKVKGKIFYRVAAAGFGPKSARGLCGTVKSAGRGCFAYAAANPPKGAMDSGIRIAARTR
ncbi:MAG: tetratricopeptide repeat protein [Pseudomonadota bacterium]